MEELCALLFVSDELVGCSTVLGLQVQNTCLQIITVKELEENSTEWSLERSYSVVFECADA